MLDWRAVAAANPRIGDNARHYQLETLRRSGLSDDSGCSALSQHIVAIERDGAVLCARIDSDSSGVPTTFVDLYDTANPQGDGAVTAERVTVFRQPPESAQADGPLHIVAASVCPERAVIAMTVRVRRKGPDGRAPTDTDDVVEDASYECMFAIARGQKDRDTLSVRLGGFGRRRCMSRIHFLHYNDKKPDKPPPKTWQQPFLYMLDKELIQVYSLGLRREKGEGGAEELRFVSPGRTDDVVTDQELLWSEFLPHSNRVVAVVTKRPRSSRDQVRQAQRESSPHCDVDCWVRCYGFSPGRKPEQLFEVAVQLRVPLRAMSAAALSTEQRAAPLYYSRPWCAGCSFPDALLQLRYVPLIGRKGERDHRGVLCEQHTDGGDGAVHVTLHCLRARNSLSMAIPLEHRRAAGQRVLFLPLPKSLVALYLPGHFVHLVDAYHRHRAPRHLLACSDSHVARPPSEDLHPGGQLTEQMLQRHEDASLRFAQTGGSIGHGSTPFTDCSLVSPGPPHGAPRRMWGSLTQDSPALQPLDQPVDSISALPLSPGMGPQPSPGSPADSFMLALSCVTSEADGGQQQLVTDTARAVLQATAAAPPGLLLALTAEGWRHSEYGGYFSKPLGADAAQRLHSAVARCCGMTPTPGPPVPEASSRERSPQYTPIMHADHGGMLLDLRACCLYSYQLNVDTLYPELFRRRTTPPSSQTAILHLLLQHRPELAHNVLTDVCRGVGARATPVLFKEFLLAETATATHAALREDWAWDFVELVPCTALTQQQSHAEGLARLSVRQLPDSAQRSRTMLQLPVAQKCPPPGGPDSTQAGLSQGRGGDSRRGSASSSSAPGFLTVLRDRLATLPLKRDKAARAAAQYLTPTPTGKVAPHALARHCLEEGILHQLSKRRPRAVTCASEYAAQATRKAAAVVEMVLNALAAGRQSVRGAQWVRQEYDVLAALTVALEETSFPRPEELNLQLAKAAFGSLSRRSFLQAVRSGIVILNGAILEELRAEVVRQKRTTFPGSPSPMCSPRTFDGPASRGSRIGSLRQRMSTQSMTTTGSDVALVPVHTRVAALADVLSRACEDGSEGDVTPDAQRKVEDALTSVAVAELTAPIFVAAEAGGWNGLTRRFRSSLTSTMATRMRDAAAAAAVTLKRDPRERTEDDDDIFLAQLALYLHKSTASNAIEALPDAAGWVLSDRAACLAGAARAEELRRDMLTDVQYRTDFMPFEALRALWDRRAAQQRGSCSSSPESAWDAAFRPVAQRSPEARDHLSEHAAQWLSSEIPEIVQLRQPRPALGEA